MRCERTMREVRLNAGKQQGSAPRAVDWPVRSPSTFTRCDLSLSKTPNGAILPQNHSESGECRLNVIPERPWSSYDKGKLMTQTQLAALLKPYDIRSKMIRFGTETARGYAR